MMRDLALIGLGSTIVFAVLAIAILMIWLWPGPRDL